MAKKPDFQGLGCLRTSHIMLRETSQEKDSFKQLLRCKLETLERELLEAHFQGQQCLDPSDVKVPVPYKRPKVSEKPLDPLSRITRAPKSSTLLQASCSERLLHKSAFEQFELPTKQRKTARFDYESQQVGHCGSDKSEGAMLMPVCDAPDSPSSKMSRKFLSSISQLEGTSMYSPSMPIDSVKADGANEPQLTLRQVWLSGTKHNGMKKSRRTRLASKMNDMLAAMEHRKKRQTLAIQFVERANFSCVIQQYSKPWMSWEMFGFFLLMLDVIYIPMQVFEIPPSTVLDVFKWTALIYWTLTLFLTFFVSFQSANATLVTDNKAIFFRYLRGWFALDLLLVSADWISVVIEMIVSRTDSGLRSSRLARMARLGRVLRTMRVLRVMRVTEILQRIDSVINSEHLSICFLLAWNIAAILFLAHITACAWFYIGNSSTDRSWLKEADLVEANFGDQYMYSVGWSLSTLLNSTLTVIFPKTKVEYAGALVILVIGAIAIALVFSSTTAAMTRLQQLKAGERQASFNLKNYLKQNHISSSLAARVMRYVDIAKSVHSKRIPSDRVLLLNLLSGPLRHELQLELHAPHMVLHKFFKVYYYTNHGAMSELCLEALGFVYLSRYDSLFQSFSPSNHMYFLVGGVMVYRRAKGALDTRQTVKIDKNSNFCELAIWTHWTHHGGMKALIESQILALNATSFCEITESHPDVFKVSCQYSLKYLHQIHDNLSNHGYVWDVPSESMYPEKYKDSDDRGSFSQDPEYVKFLAEAEELSAELMDNESDSDSEDERMLRSALAYRS